MESLDPAKELQKTGTQESKRLPMVCIISPMVMRVRKSCLLRKIFCRLSTTFLVDVDYFFSRCRLFFECRNRDRQIKMYKNSAYIIGVRIYSLINIMEVKLCTYVDVKNISVVGLENVFRKIRK